MASLGPRPDAMASHLLGHLRLGADGELLPAPRGARNLRRPRPQLRLERPVPLAQLRGALRRPEAVPGVDLGPLDRVAPAQSERARPSRRRARRRQRLPRPGAARSSS